MDHPPELTIVIPAYNEAARLGATLTRVLGYLEHRRVPFEVLVADDGSGDGTASVAMPFAERGVSVTRTEDNRGKGAATRRAVLASRGRQVLLTDADLSTPIEELERLEARRDRAELVIGSRAVEGARIVVRQPIYRELMGKAFNRLIRLGGVRGLSDTQCGFKLLDGDVARRLFAELRTDGFAYDVELVWLARRAGYRVVEVGVTWANSADSRVRPVRDALSMLAEIARFRWHHHDRRS